MLRVTSGLGRIQNFYWFFLLCFFGFWSLLQTFSLCRSMWHQFVKETHLSVGAAHFHMHDFFSFFSGQKQFNTIQSRKLTCCIGVFTLFSKSKIKPTKKKKKSLIQKKFSIPKSLLIRQRVPILTTCRHEDVYASTVSSPYCAQKNLFCKSQI